MKKDTDNKIQKGHFPCPYCGVVLLLEMEDKREHTCGYCGKKIMTVLVSFTNDDGSVGQEWIVTIDELTPSEHKELGISYHAQAVDLLQALVDSWRVRSKQLRVVLHAIGELSEEEWEEIGYAKTTFRGDSLYLLIKHWRMRGDSLRALAEANEVLQDKLCEVMEVKDANE